MTMEEQVNILLRVLFWDRADFGPDKDVFGHFDLPFLRSFCRFWNVSTVKIAIRLAIMRERKVVSMLFLLCLPHQFNKGHLMTVQERFKSGLTFKVTRAREETGLLQGGENVVFFGAVQERFCVSSCWHRKASRFCLASKVMTTSKPRTIKRRR
jgi:hypothetical protein